MPMQPPCSMSPSEPADPQDIAICALQWIAGDPQMLARFAAVTGIAPAAMRNAASEPGFLPGVLDFLLAHEPTLMRCCSQTDIDPAAVSAARNALAGRSPPADDEPA